MTNEIETTLIAARDAFDKYAHHHLVQWQAIKDDPEQAEQAAKRWQQYKQNVALGDKMRGAMVSLVRDGLASHNWLRQSINNDKILEEELNKATDIFCSWVMEGGPEAIAYRAIVKMHEENT